MKTIYLDVLLCLNLYINYFVLRATAKLLHAKLRTGRCLLAAGVGSLFSLTILLPPMPPVYSILFKLLATCIILMLAVGVRQKRLLLGGILCFFGISFGFAGLLLAIGSCFGGKFVTYGNGSCYLDFSLLQLILFTLLAYGAMQLVQRLRNRLFPATDPYQVYIRQGEKLVLLPGLPDTGNQLTDCFSGRMVIVCSAEQLHPLFPPGKTIQQMKHYRILPCTTVSSSGMIPVFLPDEIVICNQATGMRRSVDAMIGIGQTQGNAVFHPKLIPF